MLTEFHTWETCWQCWVIQPNKRHQQVLSGWAWHLSVNTRLLSPVWAQCLHLWYVCITFTDFAYRQILNFWFWNLAGALH